MTTQKKALLVVGSSKPGASASLTLGSALTDRLAARDFEVETMRIAKALRTAEPTQAMLEAVDAADLIVLASPLFVDSLPAPVIRAFELVASRRRGPTAGEAASAGQPTAPDTGGRPFSGRPQQFVAIVNCGFPESKQCATAIEICRLFARDAGFAWAGGLAMGMGGALGGGNLQRFPGARFVIPALDLAAEALARGDEIPAEAIELMGRPAMPPWLYLTIGNLGWRMQARGKTGGRSLKERPYVAA